MDSLCLGLRVGIVTQALHAQPDCCVTGTSRPFTRHLIRHFIQGSEGLTEGVGAELDDAASAQMRRFFLPALCFVPSLPDFLSCLVESIGVMLMVTSWKSDG